MTTDAGIVDQVHTSDSQGIDDEKDVFERGLFLYLAFRLQRFCIGDLSGW